MNIKLYTIICCVILIIILAILLTINWYCKRDSYVNFVNKNSIYTAIIIEPRKHRALELVLVNFINNLDYRWNIIIFHGNKNVNYTKNIIDNNPVLMTNKHRIKLINLNVDNLSIDDYNKLLKTKSFYDNIPTEMFLVFQTDTMICSHHKNNIYKFIDYDYVGAPWIDGNVGNGGLSLRRKSKMIEIIDKNNLSQDKTNEDLVFSGILNNLVSVNKPSFLDAKNFSIESVHNNKSFGLHKPWNYLKEEELIQINNFCPGFNDLRRLQ